MTQFSSRAVRSLVELHEVELRNFLATWRRFVASGKPMPEAHGDEDYESPEKLVTHIQGSARGYLMWTLTVLELPKPELDMVRDPTIVVPRLDAYMDETLAAWRQFLAPLTDDHLGPITKYAQVHRDGGA